MLTNVNTLNCEEGWKSLLSVSSIMKLKMVRRTSEMSLSYVHSEIGLMVLSGIVSVFEAFTDTTK